MRILSSTEFRANLAKVLDQVADDHAPVIIHRSTGKPVVLVSLEDWEAMDETTYLLSSPANAEHLRRAKASLEAGNVVVRTMEALELMGKE